jgi:hypothetical protein
VIAIEREFIKRAPYFSNLSAYCVLQHRDGQFILRNAIEISGNHEKITKMLFRHLFGSSPDEAAESDLRDEVVVFD